VNGGTLAMQKVALNRGNNVAKQRKKIKKIK
jgi:hypothetical protein